MKSKFLRATQLIGITSLLSIPSIAAAKEAEISALRDLIAQQQSLIQQLVATQQPA